MFELNDKNSEHSLGACLGFLKFHFKFRLLTIFIGKSFNYLASFLQSPKRWTGLETSLVSEFSKDNSIMIRCADPVIQGLFVKKKQ